MRIRELSLIAYGPFSDRVLDFGVEPRALQLVYGPNEAGKSTTLRAVTSLLYGIPMRTGDAHVHDMTKLRIGATLLDEQGQALSIVRRKGNKQTLLDAEGKPLADGVLAPLLGGLDEALFQQMFGLDHERLRRGAEELLRGGGQLGEVLFDASTGGRGVHKLIDGLRAEAEALYKARGKTPDLNAALDGLREQKKRRADAMLSPQAFADQRKALAEARVERARALEARTELLTEKSRLSRTLSLLPLIARHDTLTADLAQLTARGAARTIETGLEESVRELERRYGSVLAQERATPARRAELAAHEREIAVLRERLGRDAEGLTGLETATRTRVRKLVEEASALRAEALELTRRDAAAAEEERRLEARREALGTADAGALAELVASVERDDLLAQLARLEGELDRVATQLARGLGKLDLTIDEAALAQLTLPSDARVEELARAFVAAERELERQAEHRERLDAERARLDLSRAELLATGSIATAAELAEARAVRDAAFDLLMNELAQQTEGERLARARRYGAALAHADALADRLAREAQRASELSRLDAARARLEREHERVSDRHAEARATLAEVRERWTRDVPLPGLAERTPAAARPLLVELALVRDQARERARLVALQQTSCETARACARELASALGTAEDASGPARALLERTLRSAREQLAVSQERARERAIVRARLGELSSQRAGYTGRRRAVTSEQQDVDARYAQQLGELGLGRALTSDELLACLDELAQLGQRRREASELDTRLRADEEERAAFARDLRALCERLLPELVDLPAERALEQLAGLVRERREAERDDTRLRSELQKLDAQLGELGDGAPLARLREAVSDIDPHTARARLVELDDLLDAQTTQLGDLDQTIGRLEAGLEHLEQVSGAASLAEDFEHDLARARTLAKRYVELRVALALLTREVERYRSEHQAPLLARASELFPRLTLGRYRALTVEYDDKDEPVLSCVLADGKTARVGALSDGTRDQLYLALRVASIERYFEGKPPLPLVLDDALIHFDDARAVAALSVLGTLCERTQVLFFTHHARMIDLAVEALGPERVCVHELLPRPIEEPKAPPDHGPLFSVV